MAVGIVIPCKDQKEYLSDCISSLLSQTLKPSSVVIVDDGSKIPITSEDLPKESAGFPIWLVRNEESVGIAGARNIGITLVGTNWFIPLDADDQLVPECIERCCEIIELYPEVRVVQFGFERFGDDEYQDLRYPYPWTLKSLQTQCPAHHTALIHTAIWEEVGGYVDIGGGKVIRGYEDWDFWIRVFNHPHHYVVHTLRDALLRYRYHEDSKSFKQDRVEGRTELTVKYRQTWNCGNAAAKALKELRTLFGVERIDVR